VLGGINEQLIEIIIIIKLEKYKKVTYQNEPVSRWRNTWSEWHDLFIL